MKIYYIDNYDLKIKSRFYDWITNQETFFYEMDELYPLGWSQDEETIKEHLEEI